MAGSGGEVGEDRAEGLGAFFCRAGAPLGVEGHVGGGGLAEPRGVLLQGLLADRARPVRAGRVRGLLQAERRVDGLHGSGDVAVRAGLGDRCQLAQYVRADLPKFCMPKLATRSTMAAEHIGGSACAKCYSSVVVSGSVACARTSTIQRSMSGRRRSRRPTVSSLSGDFRPQAGQVPLAVEPRDAQGVQSPGQLAAVVLAVVRGRPAHGLDADLQGGRPAVGAGV